MGNNPSRYKPKFNESKQLPPAKIETWIKNHFEHKERKSGEELLICNPFDGDSDFKMNINPSKGVVHYWRGDDWAGPVNPKTGKRNCSFIRFVRLYKKCSYSEAIREVLGTKEGLSEYLKQSRTNDEELQVVVVTLPDGAERLADADDQQAKILINWLMQRGYSIEDIDTNNIHYLGVDVFWLYYEFDQMVYWQSRNKFNKVFRFPDIKVFDDNGMVVGKTDGSKGKFLYGFDDCEFASYVIVTESIFGKQTLGAQSMATGGAALTDDQIDKIRLLGPKNGIILSPDNDDAGVKSVISNYTVLKPLGYPIYYSIPPKVEFNKNGETKFTKDFNEFVQYLKMTPNDVRKMHDNNIKKMSAPELARLHSRLKR